MAHRAAWTFSPGSIRGIEWKLGVASGAFVGLATWILGPLPAVLAVAGLYLMALLVFSPGAFLFAVVIPYSSLQIFLREMPALQIAGVSINASQAFMMGLTSLMLFRMLGEFAVTRQVPRPTAAHWLHAGFLFWCGLLFLRAPSSDGTTIIGRLVACMVIHFVGYWLASRGRFWVLATVGGTAIVAAASAVLDRVIREPALESITVGAIRSRGAFTTAVATAVIAFAGLPVFAELWLRRAARAERLVASAGFVAIGLALLFTLTRTAILGVVLFAITIAMWRPRGEARQRRLRPVHLVLPVLLILGLLYWVPEEYLEARVQDLSGFSQEAELSPELGSGRIGIWSAIVDEIASSGPIEIALGHGPGEVWNVTERTLAFRYDSHNSYLSVLFDFGVGGLLLYLLLLGSHLWILRSAPGDSPDAAVTKTVWRAYALAYALSTVLFNGYVYSAGPQWFSYLGLGYGLAAAAGVGTLDLGARRPAFSAKP